MCKDIIKLPHGVTMFTGKYNEIKFQKPNCENLVFREVNYVQHNIIGKRFVNFQYSYSKHVDGDGLGEESETAWNGYCVDLLTWKSYDSWIRKYLKLYVISDTKPEILSFEDRLFVFRSLEDKKGLKFAYKLPIMYDDRPFYNIANNLYCMMYADDEGRLYTVIFFDIRTGRRWKKIIQDVSNIKQFAQNIV